MIRDPSLSLKAQSQFLEHRVETEEDTVLEVRARAASENSPDSVLERRQASAEAVEEQSMGSWGLKLRLKHIQRGHLVELRRGDRARGPSPPSSHIFLTALCGLLEAEIEAIRQAFSLGQDFVHMKAWPHGLRLSLCWGRRTDLR